MLANATRAEQIAILANILAYVPPAHLVQADRDFAASLVSLCVAECSEPDVIERFVAAAQRANHWALASILEAAEAHWRLSARSRRMAHRAHRARKAA